MKINKESNKKPSVKIPEGPIENDPEGSKKVPLVVPGQPIDMIVAGPVNSVP